MPASKDRVINAIDKQTSPKQGEWCLDRTLRLVLVAHGSEEKEDIQQAIDRLEQEERIQNRGDRFRIVER